MLVAGKAIAGPLLFLLGGLRTRGQDKVVRNGGLLILANHRSDLDPVILQCACPRHVHFMAKSELFDMRFVRFWLRLWRAFPVVRGEPDRAALKHAIELLKAGHAVCVFPEGELSESGEMLPLKPGVALIARQASVSAQCAWIDGSARILPYGRLMPRFAWRRVKVVWGEPANISRETEAQDFLSWANEQFEALSRSSEPRV